MGLLSFLIMAVLLSPTSAKITSTICSPQTRYYNTQEMERLRQSTREFPNCPWAMTLTLYLHTHGAAHTINSTLISKSTAVLRIWKRDQTIGQPWCRRQLRPMLSMAVGVTGVHTALVQLIVHGMIGLQRAATQAVEADGL